MRSGRGASGAVALAVLGMAALGPATASGHHATASVTVRAEMLEPVPDCGYRPWVVTRAPEELGAGPPRGKCVHRGTRRVRVTWSGSCGPSGAIPEALTVRLLVRQRNPAAKQVVYATSVEVGNYQVDLQGSDDLRLYPGTRVYPDARLVCNWQAPQDAGRDGEDDDPAPVDDTEHLARAVATGDDVGLPPRLVDWDRGPAAGFCDVGRTGRNRDLGKPLDPHWGTRIRPLVIFSPATMLRRPSSTAGVRVELKGAGFNQRIRPYQFHWRRGMVVTKLIVPRRPGTIRMRVLFDGQATNWTKIRVRRPVKICGRVA
jgi:hypothetical protein